MQTIQRAQVQLKPATMSAPALKAFFGVAERWRLSNAEQMTLLGLRARSTFFKWKKGGVILPLDSLERISHLLAIYKSLQILLPTKEQADGWLRRPNKAAFLGGGTALDHLLRGGVVDLIDVRQYLDAERGGWV